jgi:hypothetical protein
MKRQFRYQQGGVLVIVSALMLVVILLGSLLFGMSWRIQQRQRLDSALRESTRTVAQQGFSYTAFAFNQPLLTPGSTVTNNAKAVLAANLANVPGLLKSPTEIAKTAQWNVIRKGDLCGTTKATEVALCGSLSVPVRSLPLGFPGTTTIHLTALTMLETSHQ